MIKMKEEEISKKIDRQITIKTIGKSFCSNECPYISEDVETKEVVCNLYIRPLSKNGNYYSRYIICKDDFK